MFGKTRRLLGALGHARHTLQPPDMQSFSYSPPVMRTLQAYAHVEVWHQSRLKVVFTDVPVLCVLTAGVTLS